ncbi:hypothetical protein C8F01DRAFT_1370155 [Mycena amicta]|nr:hypothetical protein C8F01DRAFT_1370155 [Mycena amicta]
MPSSFMDRTTPNDAEATPRELAAREEKELMERVRLSAAFNYMPPYGKSRWTLAEATGNTSDGSMSDIWADPLDPRNQSRPLSAAHLDDIWRDSYICYDGPNCKHHLEPKEPEPDSDSESESSSSSGSSRSRRINLPLGVAYDSGEGTVFTSQLDPSLPPVDITRPIWVPIFDPPAAKEEKEEENILEDLPKRGRADSSASQRRRSIFSLPGPSSTHVMTTRARSNSITSETGSVSHRLSITLQSFATSSKTRRDSTARSQGPGESGGANKGKKQRR